MDEKFKDLLRQTLLHELWRTASYNAYIHGIFNQPSLTCCSSVWLEKEEQDKLPSSLSNDIEFPLTFMFSSAHEIGWARINAYKRNDNGIFVWMAFPPQPQDEQSIHFKLYNAVIHHTLKPVIIVRRATKIIEGVTLIPTTERCNVSERVDIKPYIKKLGSGE